MAKIDLFQDRAAVHSLLTDGETLRIFAASGEAGRRVADPRVQAVRGDFDDPRSVFRLIQLAGGTP